MGRSFRLTNEEARVLIERHEWIYAKTMSDDPHEYTLRKEWNDDALFDLLVLHIREQGYATRYHGRPYVQLDVGDYFYWTMGAPLSETILVNRKRTAGYSPEQVAGLIRGAGLRTARRHGHQILNDSTEAYDLIANDYDRLFADDTSRRENEAVFGMIGDVSRLSVLDVGCGTGIFLDYARPQEYVGIDPSSRMLEKFKERHPDYAEQVLQTALADYAATASNAFDLAVGLFGVGSYLSRDELEMLPRIARRAFIMFYGPRYTPETYRKTGIFIVSSSVQPGGIFTDVQPFGNFLVVDSQ